MSLRTLLALTLAAPCLVAQNAPPPDTVLATADGQPITAGEVQAMVDAMGPQIRQFYAKDPKEFIRQYALQTKLAKIAESQKLDQESPYKERLRYSREAVLMQSLMDRRMNATPIDDGEIQELYEQKGGADPQYRTKVLYVSFVAEGKEGRPEAEAKKKADELRAQAATGGDFVALVKEHSEDQTSRDKDGDYPVMRQGDPLPEPVKKAIFALKPGELTEPIRQANGFYIFRLEKIDTKPLSEVREQIVNQIRQERFAAWFQEVQQSLDIQFQNEELLAPKPPQ
jgi:parvulin-like peptidyl-prolyl isomerase